MMTEKEIKAAFAAFDVEHPFYKAVQALLDSAVETEQDNVTIPLLTDSARQFNAGRLAHAMDIRGRMRDTMRAAIAEQLQAAVGRS